jgi:MFS transporter, OFA family, oxalate/formate antiporter
MLSYRAKVVQTNSNRREIAANVRLYCNAIHPSAKSGLRGTIRAVSLSGQIVGGRGAARPFARRSEQGQVRTMNDVGMNSAATQRGEFSMGWKVLFAGVLGVACGASPIPMNIVGLTVEPLVTEMGWTRVQATMPVLIYGVIGALLAPVYGMLADRIGVRRVALFSLAAFGLAFAALALTPTAKTGTTMGIYYGLWVLIGMVGIGSTPVTWSRAINMWFYKNRGLALGILLLGTSLTAMVVPGLAVWAINNFGWRNMFAVIALLPLLLALPIAIGLFREPTPDEQPAAIKGAGGKLTGVTLGRAVADHRFWLIWLSIACIAIAFGGIFVSIPSLLKDRGFAPESAGTVMFALGMGLLSGRIITGLMLDRIWAGFVAFPLLCLPALASYLLLDHSLTMTVAMTAGFLLGFAAGAESDLIAFLAGRYFGMAHYGKIYGMLYMPFGLCSAVSPLIYARVRDVTGSYDSALFAAIFAYLVGATLLLLLGRYPDGFPEDAEGELEPAFG